eukprot:TRINITY_DN31663_c0_g1_i2.p1 TRINITY_DN31663_c0_g1~~TRINITY_DN31663_c0_g1_i2.p1  ORF type:complete len:662 (-),score=157.77 TRINITY_DN31663_c0_g1_i2:95-2080(-)
MLTGSSASSSGQHGRRNQRRRVLISEDVFRELLAQAHTSSMEATGHLYGDLQAGGASSSTSGPLARESAEEYVAVWSWKTSQSKRRSGLGGDFELDPEELAAASEHAEAVSQKVGQPTQLLGWYHCRPQAAVPNDFDLEVQCQYQELIGSFFVGLILGQQSGAKDRRGSELSGFCVLDEGTLKKGDVKVDIVPPCLLLRQDSHPISSTAKQVKEAEEAWNERVKAYSAEVRACQARKCDASLWRTHCRWFSGASAFMQEEVLPLQTASADLKHNDEVLAGVFADLAAQAQRCPEERPDWFPEALEPPAAPVMQAAPAPQAVPDPPMPKQHARPSALRGSDRHRVTQATSAAASRMQAEFVCESTEEQVSETKKSASELTARKKGEEITSAADSLTALASRASTGVDAIRRSTGVVSMREATATLQTGNVEAVAPEPPSQSAHGKKPTEAAREVCQRQSPRLAAQGASSSSRAPSVNVQAFDEKKCKALVKERFSLETKQCTRQAKEKGLCLMHYKVMESKGKLELGTVYEADCMETVPAKKSSQLTQQQLPFVQVSKPPVAAEVSDERPVRRVSLEDRGGLLKRRRAAEDLEPDLQLLQDMGDSGKVYLDRSDASVIAKRAGAKDMAFPLRHETIIETEVEEAQMQACLFLSSEEKKGCPA